ncbi:MAG: type II toxin-antitoxin system VapC family toxin [Chloroflexota bacterium]|nr:type II toxin-antitoxin system VapC family toxin [Chloroflexota bacterium]
METSRLVLDTDIIIDHLRRHSDIVKVVLSRYKIAITAINHYELLSVPFLSKRQQISLTQLLEIVEIIPFDMYASESAAQIWNLLRSQGKTIGVLDTHIAGTCLSRKLPLLTRNVKHFQRVPDLQLISPSDF